jgi:hypothetical protein
MLTMGTPFGAVSRFVPVAPSTSTPAAKACVDASTKQQTSKAPRLPALLFLLFRSIVWVHISKDMGFRRLKDHNGSSGLNDHLRRF